MTDITSYEPSRIIPPTGMGARILSQRPAIGLFSVSVIVTIGLSAVVDNKMEMKFSFVSGVMS